MKIYISHSSTLDYTHELYEPLKRADVFSQHKFILPHDKGNEQVKTKIIIEDAEVLPSEISYPSTGQGIELGWADAAGTRIVCFYREEADISSSIRFVCSQLVVYTDSDDLIRKMIEILKL